MGPTVMRPPGGHWIEVAGGGGVGGDGVASITFLQFRLDVVLSFRSFISFLVEPTAAAIVSNACETKPAHLSASSIRTTLRTLFHQCRLTCTPQHQNLVHAQISPRCFV